MDHYTSYILANSPFITEDRIRHARREQARRVRRGIGEAGTRFAGIIRRCVEFNG